MRLCSLNGKLSVRQRMYYLWFFVRNFEIAFIEETERNFVFKNKYFITTFVQLQYFLTV
jgi:hypothetical protein